MLQSIALLLVHVFLLLVALFVAFMRGSDSIKVLISFYLFCANIFVVKHVAVGPLIFGGGTLYLPVITAATVLLRIYYSEQTAFRSVHIGVAMQLIFLIMAQFQLAYTPAAHDGAHLFFMTLLKNSPHVALSSVGVYFFSQLIAVFSYDFFRQIDLSLFMASFLALAVGQFMDASFFHMFSENSEICLSGALAIRFLVSLFCALLIEFIEWARKNQLIGIRP